MALIDFFRPQRKEAPVISATSFWGNIIQYDLSNEVYYKYYNLNPFVFSAVNKRSNDNFSNGFLLKKEWEEESNYNDEFKILISYSTTKQPKEFLKRLVRDYEIAGEAYIYIVRDEARNPLGMQILDPRYIYPVANQQGKILWYVQNLGWVRAYLTDEVYYIKYDSDIENEIRGKSRMTSLFVDVESDQEARDSNLAFFKNNQTPSSIIMVDKDFEIKEENLTQMRQKLKEMFEGGKYQGGKNKHRSLMVQGIAWIEKVQDKISDAEFLNLRQFTSEVVFSVYETPKSLLGFTNWVNYNSWDNQYEIYWDGIEAEQDKFSEFLTTVLKVFDEDYIFVGLTDNLRKLISRSNVAWSLYKDKQLITLNEARQILQYAEVDNGDDFYKESSLKITAENSEK